MPPRPKPAQHLLNLELLFNRLKNKTGNPNAQFHMSSSFDQGGVNVGPFRPVTDEGGYVPRAQADQAHNAIDFNPDRLQTQVGNGPKNHAYDRFVVAHELGHLNAAQQLDPTKVSQYLQLTHQQGAPNSQLGAGGLPLAGEGQSTHQSPNERYANDFAAALGFRNRTGGPLSAGAHGKILRLLVSHGLLPRR